MLDANGIEIKEGDILFKWGYTIDPENKHSYCYRRVKRGYRGELVIGTTTCKYVVILKVPDGKNLHDYYTQKPLMRNK